MECFIEGDVFQQLKKIEFYSQKRTQDYTTEIIISLQYLYRKETLQPNEDVGGFHLKSEVIFTADIVLSLQ
jgi:hypothetical protein